MKEPLAQDLKHLGLRDIEDAVRSVDNLNGSEVRATIPDTKERRPSIGMDKHAGGSTCEFKIPNIRHSVF